MSGVVRVILLTNALWMAGYCVYAKSQAWEGMALISFLFAVVTGVAAIWQEDWNL